jgi:drug/metabolite transporter (DMT)-like permease
MALSTGLGRGSAARQGIALLVAAMFTITVMDAGIKWLSAGYPSFQIILFRCVFGLIPVALIVAWSGGIAALRTGRPWEQALRAVCGVGAMLSFFTALALLPLAEVTALAFAAPFFVTALSVPVLGERVGARRWGAVIVGFVGVLVIVRPGTAVFTPASVLPVFASFCFALGMVLARRLSTTDSTASIVFYTTVAGILASGTGTLFVWRTPAPLDIVWLAGIGRTPTSWRRPPWWRRSSTRRCCGRCCSAGRSGRRCRTPPPWSAPPSSSAPACTSCTAK